MSAAADLSPRTVLIPLAGSGARAGHIARVQADGEHDRAGDDGLNRQIADLRDWGLYEAGAIALGAARRVRLLPQRLALFQRLFPRALTPSLAVTNGPDLMGLTPQNARSAELGLALAMLMYSGQSAARLVIATGALARDVAPGAPASDDDVAVLPVGEISRKLQAVGDAIESQTGAARADRVILFLPERTVTGEPMIELHAADISRLVERFQQVGGLIEAKPVASLGQAMAVLGVSALPVTRADRMFNAAIVASVVSIMAVLSAWTWLNAPVQLAFSPMLIANGDPVPTPAQAVFRSQTGKFEIRPVCRGPQGLPVYGAGGSLIARIAIENRSTLVDYLGGYHFVVVTVSEQSGVKLHPEQSFEAAANGVVPAREARSALAQGLSVAFAIKPPAEPNKVIVLARRIWPFDTDRLSRDLDAVTAGKPLAQRINTVVTYLAGRAPGYLDYSFISVDGDPVCSGP